jgi:hypothetical protein
MATELARGPAKAGHYVLRAREQSVGAGVRRSMHAADLSAVARVNHASFGETRCSLGEGGKVGNTKWQAKARATDNRPEEINSHREIDSLRLRLLRRKHWPYQ